MGWPPEDPDQWAVEARFRGQTVKKEDHEYIARLVDDSTVALPKLPTKPEIVDAQIDRLLKQITAERAYANALETNAKLTADAIKSAHRKIRQAKRDLLRLGWKGTSC